MDITIVIPVYNREEFVKRTINRVPETYNLIIVDNGSTDRTYGICKTICEGRANTLLVREAKRGAAAARNCGLRMCRTKWVYFFDSDDEFTGLPESWDEKLDMVCIPVCQMLNGRLRRRDYKPVADAHVHVMNSMLDTVSMIFRTEWLLGIGGWNEECQLWDDWELGLRALLGKPRLQWLDSKAYHRIFIHADSITGNDLSSRYLQAMKTLGVCIDDAMTLSEGKNQKLTLFALFLRCYFLSGYLLREGQKDAAEDVERFIYERFRVNQMSHRVGRMFQRYIGNGGRGAWRVALFFINHFFPFLM